MYPLSLTASIGSGLDNDENDVKAIATNLWSLGYPEASEAATTGQWDGNLENGIREYQRASGLAVDGRAGPGGETERSLNGSATGEYGLFERIATRAREAPRAGSESDLLDISIEPRRANPFAIARAEAAPEGMPNGDDRSGAPRRTDEALFARETVAGQPLRLQPYNLRPTAIDPPAAPGPEDVERILTDRGYRYRPDPMGRLGAGDWLDPGGNVLDAGAMQRIVDRGSPSANSALPPNVISVEDFDRFVARLPVLPAAGDDDDEGDEIAPAQDDSGGRVWGKFGAALARGGKIIGGPNPIPAELARRSNDLHHARRHEHYLSAPYRWQRSNERNPDQEYRPGRSCRLWVEDPLRKCPFPKIASSNGADVHAKRISGKVARGDNGHLHGG